nr:MAG TPA: hypothetical protein [Caudoviricetes sp.]
MLLSAGIIRRRFSRQKYNGGTRNMSASCWWSAVNQQPR